MKTWVQMDTDEEKIEAIKALARQGITGSRPVGKALDCSNATISTLRKKYPDEFPGVVGGKWKGGRAKGSKVTTIPKADNGRKVPGQTDVANAIAELPNVSPIRGWSAFMDWVFKVHEDNIQLRKQLRDIKGESDEEKEARLRAEKTARDLIHAHKVVAENMNPSKERGNINNNAQVSKNSYQVSQLKIPVFAY